MTRRNSMIISAFLFVLIFFNAAYVMSAEKTWKVDAQLAIADKYYAIPAVRECIQNIEKRTNGRLKITIYPNQGLGIKGRETLRAVSTGTIGMVWVPTPYISTDIPIAEIADLPLLAASPSEVVGIWGAIRSLADTEFDKHNVRILSVYPLAKQVMVSKRSVTTPQDWKGLKIRNQGGEAQKLIEALGATPITIETNEMYMALQRGTVEAAVTAVSSHVAMGNNEVTKFVSDFGWYIGHACLVNKQLWESWPADIKSIVMEETLKEAKANTLNSVTMGGPEPLIAKGMTLAPSSPELIKFAYSVAPKIWENWAKNRTLTEQNALSIARKYVNR